jgi:membrane protein DedA with SNARE-associated domain
MSFVYQPRELGPARTLSAISGLILLGVALWFPRESLLYGAGVLIAMVVLMGVRNSSSTMTTAWISLFTALCCITGAFMASYDKRLSEIFSVIGIGQVVFLAAFHLRSYVRRKQAN